MDKDTEIIEVLNSTSRYLDDLLNIDNNNYFYSMVKPISPSELFKKYIDVTMTWYQNLIRDSNLFLNKANRT